MCKQNPSFWEEADRLSCQNEGFETLFQWRPIASRAIWFDYMVRLYGSTIWFDYMSGYMSDYMGGYWSSL